MTKPGPIDVAIVTGGRAYDLTPADYDWLDSMYERFGFRILLHGDCRTGVDRQAAAWARRHDLCDAACPAQWDEFQRRLGRPHAAGPDRNRRIAKACAQLSAICLVFPGGRGTQDMKDQCRRHHIEVHEAPRKAR